VAEEEYRTADLLRLAAHPLAVYWGKTLFSIAESCVHAIAFAGLFLVLTSMPLVHPGLLAFGLTSSVLCICGALSVCSAIAARSSNRMGLAIVIAFPLLVPIVFLGISCLRVAMGDGLWDGGIRSGVGLLGYGVCSLTVGQYLFTAVWKR
jgi:ABC-type transport system involved in cytochrome c biogenesis permease component